MTLRSRQVARRPAYSLMEVMVVMVIIGILATLCFPSYQRTVEQSRADIAAANLRAIWSAQRLYWIEHHTYTDSLVMLQDMGLLDKSIVQSTSGYAYNVIAATASTMVATATRTGSPRWSGGFTIDQTGQVTGVVQGAGEPDISPGFN